MRVAAQVHNPHATQAEYGTGLGAGGDLELGLAGQRGHANGVAEGRLRKVDRHFAHEGVAFAFEDLVLLDLDVDVEVSARSAAQAGLAFAGDPQSRAGIDAGRDIHGKVALHPDAAAAVAALAGGRDGAARAAAPGAGARHTEEPVRRAHLPGTAAVRAGFRPGARGCAGAVTVSTQFHALELHFLFDAECGLAKRKRHSILEVVAGGRRAAPAAATTEKHVEEIFEGTLKTLPAETAEAGVAAELIGRIPEAVVFGALLGVFQRVVGRVDFLELILGHFVAPGLVRVIFMGEFEIGAADLIRSRAARNSEHFI